MEILISFLTTLNSLSPLAVIGLLATIIYLLVSGRTAADATASRVHHDLLTVKDNHLHELPEVVETLRTMAETLRRIEIRMIEEFSFLRSKVSGK